MNTRLPGQLLSRQPRKQLFRSHASGGVCLDIPAYAVEHGTLARTHRRGVSIDLESDGDSDLFLAKNEDGSVSIQLEE